MSDSASPDAAPRSRPPESERQRAQERPRTPAVVAALLLVGAGAFALLSSSAAPNGGAPEEAAQDAPRLMHIGDGEASYYGPGLAGNLTASGETFDPKKLTAAHRTLPLGTQVRVTNLRNDSSVVVRVNDRGPYARSRVIDLSMAAARQLRMIQRGKAQVRLEVLREASSAPNP